METLKVVEKKVVDSASRFEKNKNPHLLEGFKDVVKNLTENALKVLNKIAADEKNKPAPRPGLVKDYYLFYHYLDFLRRLAMKSSE